MDGADRSDSPLDSASDVAGEQAADAFELLSDETRVAILLALWEAFEPGRGQSSVSFSTLRDRVGIRDSGQFNYHLDKLRPHFVERTDDGYRLRQSGHRIVRAVVAGSGIEDPTVELTAIDVPCPHCGAKTAVTYQDGALHQLCTECEGFMPDNEFSPEGLLNRFVLDPAGILGRDPEQLYVVGMIQSIQRVQTLATGVCVDCSGTVEKGLDVCPDHDAEGVCDTCGRQRRAVAELECTVCKNHQITLPHLVVAFHPAVVAFYHDRGVTLQWADADLEQVQRINELIFDHETQVVSEAPPRLRVTVRQEGDELRVTLDENLVVADLERA